jgi:Ca2+-binding RTX toxin-like protein
MANVTGDHAANKNDLAQPSWMGGSSLGVDNDPTNNNDIINMLTGHDTVYAADGNDTISGDTGNDTLHGGGDNDTLYGGNNNDVLYGDNGVDKLYGGTGSDNFYFDKNDTGDVYQGKADTIYDFEGQDQIWLKGAYTYAGSDKTPNNGEYSIWEKGGDWVVTYNPFNEPGYNDIVVKGGDPHGDISFY